jgi:hypothetical protein
MNAHTVSAVASSSVSSHDKDRAARLSILSRLSKLNRAPQDVCPESANGHDWAAPYAIVGGDEPEFPGLFIGRGKDGFHEHVVCMCCGTERTTITNMRHKLTGFITSIEVTYNPGEYAEQVRAYRADNQRADAAE